MEAVMPSIRDFSGGVLNQELQNRDNGNGVLFDSKNVVSSWNGELRKRTGTRWLRGLEGNSKMIPFRLPNGDDMLMLLRDKVINCYTFDDNDDLVPYQTYTGGTAIAFPTTGWNSNTNGNWTIGANGTTSAYKVFNVPYLHADRFRYSDNTINSRNAYFSFYNSTANVFSSVQMIWQDAFANSSSQNILCGDVPVIQYSDDGTEWISIQTNFSKDITVLGENYGFGTFYTTVVAFNIKNDSHFEEHKHWRVVFTEKYQRGSHDQSSSEFACINVKFTTQSTFSDLVFNNCPYENEDFDNIRWSQNDKTLTMVCRGKQPYQISVTSLYVFSDSLFLPSDFTSMWTNYGYPACVAYYQNRLWFGGFDLYPTRVCASAFGQFDKFTIPSPILATSPIRADGTEISNIIENMWGGNNALYCLSADGVSMIDAQGAIVAADQVEFKLRNREPVNSMVPTVKDDIMIYLGRDKRKILITDFDFVVQRFKANCISDNYTDFLQSGIRELHYIPGKASLIYGLLENGKGFTLLFNIDKAKNSLYPFEVSGNMLDVQPIKQGDQTKLVILTQLPTYQYILEEKIVKSDQQIMDFMTKEEKESYTKSIINSAECYLDHSINRKYDLATTEVGSVPYYEGEKIEVIADGNYLGEQTVLARPSVQLYAWQVGTSFFDGEKYVPGVIVYTDTATPTTESALYDASFNKIDDYSITSVTAGVQIVVRHSALCTLLGYTKTGTTDENVYMIYNIGRNIVTDENGVLLGFASTYSDSELTFNDEHYDRNADIDHKVVLSGLSTTFYRDSADDTISGQCYIALDEKATNVVLGIKYDSYAVLKFVSPYNIRKFPKEISVNFINSGYLEVGNTFDSLKSVLNNLVESVNISNEKILMNGNYTKTLDKQAFETPYVIVRSDKGLPFIITGIDYKVDMSNYQGGV